MHNSHTLGISSWEGIAIIARSIPRPCFRWPWTRHAMQLLASSVISHIIISARSSSVKSPSMRADGPLAANSNLEESDPAQVVRCGRSRNGWRSGVVGWPGRTSPVISSAPRVESFCRCDVWKADDVLILSSFHLPGRCYSYRTHLHNGLFFSILFALEQPDTIAMHLRQVGASCGSCTQNNPQPSITGHNFHPFTDITCYFGRPSSTLG